MAAKSSKPRLASPKAPATSTPPATPAWPGYGGVSQIVGTSPSGKVTIYADPKTGAPGLQNAQDLLKDADRIMSALDAAFGAKGEAVSVIIYAMGGHTDGAGADHGGCDFKRGGAIEVCASFGDSPRVSALFAAELSECYMGGHLCGASTGEALSRWFATLIGHNPSKDAAMAPPWAENGMKNFVDRTEPTDIDGLSIGCGTAFLSWLLSLGHPLGKIAPAMVALGDKGTLAQLFAKLGGGPAANAWPQFIAAAKGLKGGVVSDDPFGGALRHQE